MYNLLIEFLKEKQVECQNELDVVQRKYNLYKPIVLELKPKGGKFKKENLVHLLTNEKLYVAIEECIKNINSVPFELLIKNKINYTNYIKDVEKLFKEANVNMAIIHEPAFINYLESQKDKNPMMKKVYEEVNEMAKRDDALHKTNEEITLYICNLMFELYETAEEERSKLRFKEKHIKEIITKINNEKNLDLRDISLLNNLINLTEEENEIKDELFLLVNLYVTSYSKKKEIEEIKKEEFTKNISSSYYDEEVVIEEKDDVDDLIYNYFVTIKSIENETDLIAFLESINYNYNSMSLIEQLLGILEKEEYKDEKLKNILIKYAQKKNVIKYELNSADNKENIILFYDFLDSKNKLLDDIKKNNISEDYYQDILNGIESLKNGTGIRKSKSITDIQKVLKLRVNDIRITYKRLKDNVYIILGIFCKKDRKGYNVINVTLKRDLEMKEKEKAITSAYNMENNIIFDTMLEKNEALESDLNLLLSKHVK